MKILSGGAGLKPHHRNIFPVNVGCDPMGTWCLKWIYTHKLLKMLGVLWQHNEVFALVVNVQSEHGSDGHVIPAPWTGSNIFWETIGHLVHPRVPFIPQNTSSNVSPVPRALGNALKPRWDPFYPTAIPPPRNTAWRKLPLWASKLPHCSRPWVSWGHQTALTYDASQFLMRFYLCSQIWAYVSFTTANRHFPPTSNGSSEKAKPTFCWTQKSSW